jgi:hypothetical protein
VQLEEFGQLKNPMTSLGIEPITFQLVAQCLNHSIVCTHGNGITTYISVHPNTASSSVGDGDRHIIIRKLLDSTFNIQ